MKFRIVILGVLFCLGVPAQGQTTDPNAKSTKSNQTQSANRMKLPTSTAPQELTGCVDQQNGHYVLRDVQTSQLLNLQAPGSDQNEWFAKHVGHQVQATGTKSETTLMVSRIVQVADMCGTGK